MFKKHCLNSVRLSAQYSHLECVCVLVFWEIHLPVSKALKCEDLILLNGLQRNKNAKK